MMVVVVDDNHNSGARNDDEEYQNNCSHGVFLLSVLYMCVGVWVCLFFSFFSFFLLRTLP